MPFTPKEKSHVLVYACTVAQLGLAHPVEVSQVVHILSTNEIGPIINS